MSKSIYINIPVKDVAAARKFYTEAGFGVNEAFSNDQNAIMIIDERIMLMLVAEDFFKENTKREIADTKTVSEVALAIDVENREEVDKIVDAAVAAGGTAVETLDDEIMYTRGFTDLDGHRFDVLNMKTPS